METTRSVDVSHCDVVVLVHRRVELTLTIFVFILLIYRCQIELVDTCLSMSW
jgi:hypothetical protein